MDIYICPMCGQENPETNKYCVACNTWLVDAKKKKPVREKKKSYVGSVFVVLAIVVGVLYFSDSAGGPFSSTVTFDSIEVGSYTFSQLEISPGTKTTIPVDLTVSETSNVPLEIAAVFYDENGKRLGRASTIVVNQLPAGYQTTLNLKLDQPADLTEARSVRMEVKPLAPFELLQKTADTLQQ